MKHHPQSTAAERFKRLIAYDPMSGLHRGKRADGGRVNMGEVNTNPTEGQKLAGNYRKGHTRIHGLDISIENPRGSIRTAKDGSWKVRMPCAYGYIRGTEGSDGDHVDCYLGPHLKSPHVFVIDQNDLRTGKHDEHKCMIGFGSKTQAKEAYHQAFSDGKGKDRIGHIETLSVPMFKLWLSHGNTKKPIKRASGGSVRKPGSTYNTELSPLDEMAYRQWVKDNNVPTNPDATAVQDYDMRGFYQGLQQQNPRAQSAIDPNDSQMHYPDYWKTPIHQTFSNESQWAPANAPSWTDDDKLVQPNGRVVFDDRNKPSDAAQLLTVPRAGGGNVRKPRFADFRRSENIEDRRNDNSPVENKPWGFDAEPWASEQIAATSDYNPLSEGLGIGDIYYTRNQRADGGRVHMADGGTPNPFDDFDNQHASTHASNPFDDFDTPAKTAPSGGIASYLPKAITDVPHEMYQAGAEQIGNIKNAWNERHARHEAQAIKDSGPNASFFDPGAMVNSLKDVADTGKMVLGAASIIPSTLIAGPARSLIGHPLADAEHLVGSIINPQQAAKDNPEQMYQTAKGDVDTALSAVRPRGPMVKAPSVPGTIAGPHEIPADAPSYQHPSQIPAPPPPESVANTQAADEFGIKLSRGQATGDLDTIRYEDMAARGAYGKDLQDKAVPFFEKQFQDTQAAGHAVGQQTARTAPVADTPSDAASAVGSEVADRAARARALQAQTEQQAATEAESQRGILSDQNRALSDALRGSSLPIANPTEAGEVVGANVRQAAAANRAEFQARYREFGELPGEFRVDAVRGLGTRVRNEIGGGDNPIIIDDQLTPAASRAIQALDEMSVPRIQNRASPNAAPNPDEIAGVNLRGIDQMRKKLVAYYQAARTNPTDARAVQGIIHGFDGQIERAITEGLFSGDPRALEALQEARASYARYRRTFSPQGAGDDVGTAMRRIVERNATPEETANMIIGSGKIGNSGLPVRIADRLEQVLGADSDSWSALRQAMWQKASQVRNSAGVVDPAKSAQSINDFTGTTLAQRMFTAQERAAMRAHAQGIQDLDRNIEQLPATRTAERTRQAYQDTFGGADLGGTPKAVFQKMVQGTATPEEIANGVFKVIGAGNPGHVTRALQAIERIVGPNSDAMGAIRQGVWQKLTQAAAGKDQPGAQKAMQAINEFLNGSGKTIAEQLYSPSELALMDRYQKALKLTIIPKYARTNSDTAPALLAAVRKYAGMVGSALGVVGLGGAEGGLSGYAVSKLLDKGGEKFLAARQSKKLENSLNNVVPPPVKPVTPPSPKSARILPLSVQPGYRGPGLGSLQGPVPADADEKKKRPGGIGHA
jgi:hypothetical protein